MAYDEDLAHRIRELLGDERGLSEMSMFGGLAFLLHGNMAVAASGQGGLMVRVGPEAGERLLAKPHARAMEMRGRKMTGWIRVDDDGIKTKRQLAAWVREGVRYASSLPRKG
jgi:TfoX/Sxy family transcriptional regulator of competence genes